MKPTKHELTTAIFAIHGLDPAVAVTSKHATVLWRHEPLRSAVETAASAVVTHDQISGAKYADRVGIAWFSLIRWISRRQPKSLEEVMRDARRSLVRELRKATTSAEFENTDKARDPAGQYQCLLRRSGWEYGATDMEVAEATGVRVEKVAELHRAYRVRHTRTGHYTDVVKGPDGMSHLLWSDRRNKKRRRDDDDPLDHVDDDDGDDDGPAGALVR